MDYQNFLRSEYTVIAFSHYKQVKTMEQFLAKLVKRLLG